MPTQEEQNSSPKKGGLPLWTVLVAIAVLAAVVVGGAGFFVYTLQSKKAKLERELQAVEAKKKEAEIAEAKAVQDAKLALARAKQDELLALVRGATNALEKLRADVLKLRSDAETFRTDSSGKALASQADLLALARRFYDSGLPTLPSAEDIVRRIEGARRVEEQVRPNIGTAYDPGLELQTAVQADRSWAEAESFKVTKLREELTVLIQESKVKLATKAPGADAPTLDAAITKMKDEEADARLRLKEETTKAATAAAELERAKAEADKILAAAKKEAEAVRDQIREENTKAALDRTAREAALKLEETKAKVAVQTKEDEAQKVILRKKASDPKIQAELAPFITPGYMQVHVIGAEKKPYSYTELKNYGALSPGVAGMSKLVRIATHPSDKVRPRWKMNHQLFQRYPDNVEKVTQVQNLLIELGPGLVDMGLLQP